MKRGTVHVAKSGPLRYCTYRGCQKDVTIFDLRGKILELNNILSISEETKFAQQAEIQSLSQKISVLETESAKSADQQTQIESLVSKIASLEKENQQLIESTDKEILEAQLKAFSTLEQVEFLTEFNSIDFFIEFEGEFNLIELLEKIFDLNFDLKKLKEQKFEISNLRLEESEKYRVKMEKNREEL